MLWTPLNSALRASPPSPAKPFTPVPPMTFITPALSTRSRRLPEIISMIAMLPSGRYSVPNGSRNTLSVAFAPDSRIPPPAMISIFAAKAETPSVSSAVSVGMRRGCMAGKGL